MAKVIYRTPRELRNQKYEILESLTKQYQKEYRLNEEESKKCALWHFNCMISTSKYVYQKMAKKLLNEKLK